MPNVRVEGGFNTRRYRLLRRALIEECKTTGRGCFLCGEGFDWSIVDSRQWRHPRYFHAHHAEPLAHGGAPVDPLNLVPAHKICNEKYGTGEHPSPPSTGDMPHSEEWP